MFIHVDDTRLTGPSNEDLEWCKTEVAKRFDIKDTTNSKRYLGLKLECTDEGIKLSRELYIQDLLQEFGMEECYPMQTPLDPGIDIKINKNEDPGYNDEFIKEAY